MHRPFFFLAGVRNGSLLLRVELKHLAADENGCSVRYRSFAAHFYKSSVAASQIFHEEIFAAMIDLAVSAAHKRIFGKNISAAAAPETDLFFIERQSRGSIKEIRSDEY